MNKFKNKHPIENVIKYAIVHLDVRTIDGIDNLDMF